MEQPKPQNSQERFTVTGLIAGVALGYPLSYYFQSRALQAKMSLGQYVGKLSPDPG